MYHVSTGWLAMMCKHAALSASRIRPKYLFSFICVCLYLPQNIIKVSHFQGTFNRFMETPMCIFRICQRGATCLLELLFHLLIMVKLCVCFSALVLLKDFLFTSLAFSSSIYSVKSTLHFACISLAVLLIRISVRRFKIEICEL